MKKINTNKDRLESLKKRGDLIKESFHETFNNIKRIDEDFNRYDSMSQNRFGFSDHDLEEPHKSPNPLRGKSHNELKVMGTPEAEVEMEKRRNDPMESVVREGDDLEESGNNDEAQPIEDGINPITGYDLDKESPGLPKRKPYSTTHTPTTYSSSQIEKSRTDIRNNRDSQNY